MTKLIKNDEIDLRAVFSVLWNRRRIMIISSAFAIVLAIIYIIFASKLYRSEISLHPVDDSGIDLGALSALASTFGKTGVGGTDLYLPDVLNSDNLKLKLISTQWTSKKHNEPVSLTQYWKVQESFEGVSIQNMMNTILGRTLTEAETEQRNILKTLDILEKRISVTEETSGLIRVGVNMEEPQLAANIANSIGTILLNHLTDTRNQQARAKREFLEGRLEDANLELKRSEDRLTEFRNKNSSISTSPSLQLEFNRLTRNVEIQSQIYISLRQQFELARVEEINSTPQVLILDQAQKAIKPFKPNKPMVLILMVLLALIVSPIYILLSHAIVSSPGVED